ncbi:MAG: hypothetical protein EZS28_052616, partial [Streblomastix strix]
AYLRDRMTDEVVIAADKSNPSDYDIQNSQTFEFYKNDVRNYQDCDRFLDKVYEQEMKRPFKISFDFGTVIQRSEPKQQEGNKIFRYSIVDNESYTLVSHRINRLEENRTVIHILSIDNDQQHCFASHIEKSKYNNK